MEINNLKDGQIIAARSEKGLYVGFISVHPKNGTRMFYGIGKNGNSIGRYLTDMDDFTIECIDYETF